MQRIHVARESIDQRLIGTRLIRDLVIGLAARHFERRGLRAGIAAESAGAPDERGHPIAEAQLTGLRVLRFALERDETRFALVDDRSDLARRAHLAGRRDRAEHLDPLLAVHQHREVEAADLVEREAAHAGDHRVGRQHLLVLLGAERELIDTAADAERVQHRVLGGPGSFGRRTFEADGLGIEGHGFLRRETSGVGIAGADCNRPSARFDGRGRHRKREARRARRRPATART